MQKKQKWYYGESVVIQYYEDNGYVLIKKNFTIRWWEVDLVMCKDNIIVFVEVKVIDAIKDISWYITKNKLKFTKKTINCYLLKYDIDKDYRLDIVFLKDGTIFEVYDNIEF